MRHKATIGILICALLFFTACEIVGGIFKAGMWTGVLLVALVIGLIIFLISRIGKK